MTHYETLAVATTATDTEIKAAYRRLSRMYHPDLAGAGGEVMMGRVNEAYDALKNSELRAEYDRSLVAPEPVSVPEPDVVPDTWGTEEAEWAEEPQPGARHRADDLPAPVVNAPSMRRTRTHWLVAGGGVLALIGVIAVLLIQWQVNAVSSGSWKLLTFPILISGAIQLFKGEFGWKIQAMLALGMLIPLGATGIWVLGPAWDALGPWTGCGLAAIGPLVWTVRIALTGWSPKRK